MSEPATDVFDLLRRWRHKPPPPPPGPEDYKKLMMAVAPVISYGPTSGVGLGFAGNLAFYKGFPGTTSISSLVASAIVTSKSQLLVNAKLNTYTLNNRWRMEGDNRLYWTSQKTYGLGTDTSDADAVDQKYDYYAGFGDLSATLMINIADVPATELLQPGSRVSRAVLFAGEPGDVAAFREHLEASKQPGERLKAIEGASPEIRASSDRAGRFLSHASLVSVLLSAVAVAMAARRYAARHL